MGVWIDTDMGFDDIVALLMVHQSGQVIDGVSLVFGNAPLAQVQRNAAAAAAVFNWTFPIYVGRDQPVLAPLETAQRILGDTGIPTVGAPLPDGPERDWEPAFEALCRWLEAGNEPRRVLALGPLTNIATLALARPDIAARISELVWLGGAVAQGNHTPSAEFNAYADPEAVAIVLAHKLPLRMVELDICRQVQVGPDAVPAIRNELGTNAGYLADMLAGYVEIGTSRGRPSMAVYDPVAAAAFIDPDLVKFRPVRIDIELSGTHTRGRTVVDARPTADANAYCAAAIDSRRALSMVLASLTMEAR